MMTNQCVIVFDSAEFLDSINCAVEQRSIVAVFRQEAINLIDCSNIRIFSFARVRVSVCL